MMQAGGTSPVNTRSPQPVGYGPGGLGGAAQADFDSLIDLITSTVAPTTWDGCGGAGLDRPVRDQPQPRRQPDAGSPRGNRRPAGAVAAPAGPAGDDRSPLHHAQRQLLRADRRRLRLRHRRQRRRRRRPAARSATDPITGDRAIIVRPRTSAPGAPTSRPTWTSPSRRTASAWPCRSSAASPAAGGQLGFAILSDIEAYFFIQAAQGDRRQQHAAGPQGHALQRPAGVRLRHLAEPVRDQRDPGGGRLRRRPAAGDRRALRRHVHDRAGRGLPRPALRAADRGAVLQQDRRGRRRSPSTANVRRTAAPP